MPRRRTHGDARGSLRLLVHAVAHVLFPLRFVTLLDLCWLRCVQKWLKNRLNEERTIMQEVLQALRVPKVVLLGTAACHRAGETIMYGLTTDENVRLRESCAVCLRTPHLHPGSVEVGPRRALKAGCSIKCWLCTECTVGLSLVPVHNEVVEFVQGGKVASGRVIGVDTDAVIVRHGKDVSIVQLRRLQRVVGRA